MANHTTNATALEACGMWLSESTYYSHETLGNIIYTVLSAFTQFALLIVLFLRRRKLRSQTNSYSYHQQNLDTHLLPIHILFLRISVAVYCLQAITINIPGLANAVSNNSPSTHNDVLVPCITKGIVWGLQHLCIDGVAVLLCQPGIGRRAVLQTIKWMVPWAVFTALCVSGACLATESSSVILVAAYYFLQMSVYIVVGFSNLQCQPCRHKRPAFRNYAWTWIILRSMALVSDFSGNFLEESSAVCLRFLILQTTFVSIIPWAIYVAFRDDTAFWYGYAYQFVAEATRSSGGGGGGGSKGDGKRGEKKEKEDKDKEEGGKEQKNKKKSKKSKNQKNRGRSTSDDIRRPLLGLSLPDGTLTDISVGIDSLNPSDIISFAELSIDMLKLLGSGAAAKVYKGKCRGRPVAFKLVFTPTINQKVIQAFFKEASLLRACSSHPNVVNLIGVSIAPPSLAHVLELCDGTLREELDDRRRKSRRTRRDGGGGRGGERGERGERGDSLERGKKFDRGHTSSTESAVSTTPSSTSSGASMSSVGFSDGENNSSHFNSGGRNTPRTRARNVESQHLRFFVECSLQCARSLEFLHSKNILHRDLKSLNFLIIREYNLMNGAIVVKLADMDRAVQLESDMMDAFEEKEPPKHIVGTIQWAAPEVLLMEQNSSSRASDIYSLGVVCWECLSLNPPFGSLSFRDIVRLVTSGERLPIETETPRDIVDMLERCWSATPGERPEASEIVSFFEELVSFF